MSDYFIEDKVPLPGPRPSRWDFLAKMTIGQSVLINKKHRGALRNYAHRNRIKIKSRTVSENEIRIWKIGGVR